MGRMALGGTARGHVLGAAASGLRFAVWRLPGNATFDVAIDCGAPGRRPVFAEDAPQPFFALSRFDAEDPNLPEAIAADVLIRDGVARYYKGPSYQAEPLTEVQRGLAAHPAEGRLQAAAAAALPRQTREGEYQSLVARTVEAIGRGQCRKVVLSRAEARALPPAYDLLAGVERLAAAYPTAFVALVGGGAAGTWVVATPETLLSVDADGVATMALAGTQWPPEGTALDSVSWPEKIVEEQGLVAEYIREAFRACGMEPAERGPFTVQAANLVHLRSDFQATLGEGGTGRLAALLRLLHPTSAVCGMPKEAARRFLAENEGYDRACYTGFLGPVGVDGLTDLFVNLRSAQVIGDTLLLYVGGGIVLQSDPETEWEETVRKTVTIAGVLLPGEPLA